MSFVNDNVEYSTLVPDEKYEELVPIEEINIGDWVRSWDEKTRKFRYRKVLKAEDLFRQKN